VAWLAWSASLAWPAGVVGFVDIDVWVVGGEQ
jgi:hypothetical protein